MNKYQNVWKLPHMIKITEAFTAIVDKRYKKCETTLSVFSSDFSKSYTVEYFVDGYASNDNMSYNNGILGYPIVVALILEHKLLFNVQIASLFCKINWTALNMKYNKDFSLSMNSAIKNIVNEKYDYNTIYNHISNVYRQLEVMLPKIKRYNSSYSFEDSLNGLKEIQ